jgi:hypothetical protein
MCFITSFLTQGLIQVTVINVIIIILFYTPCIATYIWHASQAQSSAKAQLINIDRRCYYTTLLGAHKILFWYLWTTSPPSYLLSSWSYPPLPFFSELLSRLFLVSSLPRWVLVCWWGVGRRMHLERVCAALERREAVCDSSGCHHYGLNVLNHLRNLHTLFCRHGVGMKSDG